MATVWQPAVRGPGRPVAVDAAVALVFLALAQLEVVLADSAAPLEAKLVGATLTTVPLAWRTAAPLPVAALTTGGFAVAVALGLPPDGSLFPIIAPIVAVYTVGAHGSAMALALAVLAGSVPYCAAIAVSGADDANVALYVGSVLGALLVGRAVRAMGFEVDALEARTTALERERDEVAQAAVAGERARIARELHDVIGHSISVMGLQAGAVRRVLRPEQERERDALLAVERTGRDSVAEMHRLLCLLREDGTGATTALPTVRRLDDLIADVRRAGLEVDLEVEGDLGDVTPGRALAAFRILQEALTNALKHAPDAHVRARVARSAAGIVVEVADNGTGTGTGTGTAPNATGGHGLVGMRERVALYGGTLAAGPAPGGGFAVRARIPEASP